MISDFMFLFFKSNKNRHIIVHLAFLPSLFHFRFKIVSHSLYVKVLLFFLFINFNILITPSLTLFIQSLI